MSKQVKQLQKTIENMRDRLKEYERKVRRFQLLLAMSAVFSGSCIMSLWFTLDFTVWSILTLINFGVFYYECDYARLAMEALFAPTEPAY